MSTWLKALAEFEYFLVGQDPTLSISDKIKVVHIIIIQLSPCNKVSGIHAGNYFNK